MEGYYRAGDVLRFIDPARPAWGLLFFGRIAEDLKLASGTWVNVGTLRWRCSDTGVRRGAGDRDLLG